MGLWKEYRESKQILNRHWPVVFFAEKSSDYQYLEHLVGLLLNDQHTIAYLTADKNDPLLKSNRQGLHVFYSKNMLAHVLNHLKADAVVMTMPDLQQFIFKRSEGVKRYVYIFHALVSTHQQYRPGAFDHYDTILGAGPQQLAEIREREERLGLPQKDLVPYGYPLLENQRRSFETQSSPSKILVAPSWYESCIFETCFEALLVQLKQLQQPVEIRFHPEYVKRRKKRYEQVNNLIADQKHIQIDHRREVWASLEETAILITDRSGIAFEFALATGRPVIFIDTPPKRFNTESADTGIEPIEDAYRSNIGYRLDPNALDQIPGLLKNLQKRDYDSIRNKIIFDFRQHEENVRAVFKTE